MYQELEITKAKDGTTVAELQTILKSAGHLIGTDYILRMNNLRVLGDTSFAAEINGAVYLISYHCFEKQRPENPPPLVDNPNMKKYMDLLRPFFEKSETVRLPVANSFWINTVINEHIEPLKSKDPT